jgi:hypothetical protein
MSPRHCALGMSPAAKVWRMYVCMYVCVLRCMHIKFLVTLVMLPAKRVWYACVRTYMHAHGAAGAAHQVLETSAFQGPTQR